MEQYIPKSAVEKILRNLWKEDDGHNAEHRICYNKALQEVQCEIDTFEVKEVGLEKEFNDFLNNVEGVPQMWHSDEQIEWAKDIAKHFFELGLKIQKGK